MEEALKPGEDQPDHAAEDQRKNDFRQGLQDQCGDVGGTVLHGLGNTEGNRKDHQTDGVVQGDDRQQHIRHRALGLVLTDDHQCGGGSGGSSDGAQGDRHRQGQQVRHNEVQGDQGDIHKDCGGYSLQDTDDDRLPSGLFQCGKAELMSDGESDEAQGDVGDHGQGIHLICRIESDSGQAQAAQHAGPDEDAGDQVGSYVRQMELNKKPGHQQTGKKGDCNQQKGLHKGFALPFMCFFARG